MERLNKMSQKKRIAELKLAAARCRVNILRCIRAGGHGHIGGAFSAIDVVTALYFDKMNINPADHKNENRDRFLLSAGHKCLCQYEVLAERGYFDKTILDTYGALETRIPGHSNMRELPGIEANTGALGHGMSIANGMAIAAKLSNKNFRVYAITGDGELPEGANWEAATAASKFSLDNLTIFVDNNGLQISGKVTDVMSMESVEDKFRSFGWSVVTIDGNDIEEFDPRKTFGKTVTELAESNEPMSKSYVENAVGILEKASFTSLRSVSIFRWNSSKRIFGRDWRL